MKYRFFELLFLLVLVSQVVVAAPQIIFNQTYTAPTSITLTDYTFDLLVSEGNTTSIQLTDADNTSVLMDEGDCETFGYERLCYINKTKEDHASLVLYDLRAQFNFSFFRGFSGDLKLGREVTAIIWMNNTGMTEAEDVDMTVTIPEGIEILDIKFCSHNETHLWWRSDIGADRNYDCNVTYRAAELMEGSFNATLLYTTFDQERNLTNGSGLFSTYIPFPINITYDNLSALEPNEEFTIYINISNNGTENLSIDDLFLDDNDIVTYVRSNSSKLSIGGNGVSGSPLIQPNSSFSAEIDAHIPYFEVSGNIPITIEYNDSNETSEFTRYIPYETIGKELIVFFSTSNNPLEALTSGTVTVSVQNPYDELVFKGYDLEVSGELFDTIYQKVPYAPSRELHTFDVAAPKTSQAYVEEIEATVTATTLKGQKTSQTETLRLKIIPIQFIILDKQVATETAQGGSVTVILSAQNTHQEEVTVTFTESSPSEAFVQGTTSATVTLQPNETKLVYEYVIIAPDLDDTIDKLNFTTTYSYQLHSSTITQEEITQVPASLLAVQTPVDQTPVVQPNITENTTVVEVIEKTSDLDIFYVIVIIVILLILAFIQFKTHIKRMYYFTVRHKLVLQKHGSLKQEKFLLHRRLKSLDKQKIKIQHEIDVAQGYLETYEKEMPQELDNLSLQKNDYLNKNQKLKKKVDALQQKISSLQADVKTFEDQRSELNRKLDANQQKHDQMLKDEETLKKDIQRLKEQYQQAEKTEILVKSESERLEKSIKHFKDDHTHHFFKQLSTIAEQREDLGRDSSKLSTEEKAIKEELGKVAKDLQLSEEDLKEMEKIFKERSSAQKRDKKKSK